MSDRALLLSIRPEYAEKILAGEKTVELRRVRPKITKGSLVLMYVSSPVKAVMGAFHVDDVIEGTPDSLWPRVARVAGVTRQQFNDYYAGTDAAYGIVVGRVWELAASVTLQHLRRRFRGFHPPQSYRYITDRDMAKIGVAEL
jgi:predicted transcriptional regulator